VRISRACSGQGRSGEDGGLVFWDVDDRSHAIVVDLEDETYNRLVVEVPDPDAAVATLRAHLSRRRPA
jgi:hypothetical protein